MNNTRFQLSVVVVALATICAVGCNTRVDVTKETDAVRVRSKGVNAAEAAKDIPGALAFWADDAIVQPPGAPQIQGKEAITKFYHQIFENSGLKEGSGMASTVTVSASGDFAFETGINRVVFSSPTGDLLDMGKYLGVWKKVNGTWYIAALSFTSDAPAPVPMSGAK